MPVPSGTWVVPTADEDRDADPLRKRAGSTAYLAFDFGNLPAVAAGATINTASVSVSPTGVTAANTVAAGSNGSAPAPYRVEAWFAGGSAGGEYTVTCTAAFTDGSEEVAKGVLIVY